MLTRFDVYCFGAFFHDYWCCKQENLKQEKSSEQLAYSVERRQFFQPARAETEITYFQASLITKTGLYLPHKDQKE